MSSAPDTLKEEIKRAIVESLRLPISVDEIENGMSLFGEGLGLDSIDVLELVLEMERRFGVSITDDETGQRVLRSVDTIADFIVSERARKIGVTNIFTVDLEDWFHVCGVSALSRDKWSALPSRVGDTTRWLLDTLDADGSSRDVFCVGMDRRGAPAARRGRPERRP